VQKEAQHRDDRDSNFDELQSLRDQPCRNGQATSPPSADRKKNGAMNTAAANVISASPSASDPEQDHKHKRRFEKIVKANANCVQNRGAKRRVNIRESMALALRSYGRAGVPRRP
jgi:hypothetical protein